MAYGDFKDLPRRTAADKDYVIKHLILLIFQDRMYIKVELLQWFISLLIKTLQVVVLEMKSYRSNNYLNIYTNQFLENLKIGKYIFKKFNIWKSNNNFRLIQGFY